MASDILHIKDSYYFEIPKVLLPAKYGSKKDFPDVWVRLDEDFQKWEFRHLYEELKDEAKLEVPDEHQLEHNWEHWSHTHENHGKPIDVYLEEHADALIRDYKTWAKSEANEGKSFDEYLATTSNPAAKEFGWFAKEYQHPNWRSNVWALVKQKAGGSTAVEEYKQTPGEWSEDKLAGYNYHLSGKILIPQPFGTLRNLYQSESGFAISKFMIVEIVVAVLVFLIFSWVAKKIATGEAPKGRAWNLLEVFLLFIRDQVAAPAIGGGQHDEAHDDHHSLEVDAHGKHLAQGAASIHVGAGEELNVHGHGHHEHHKTKAEISDEKLFTPVLWTVFFFVLGCNLFGMLPWAGSPTASFSVTLVLAIGTFACVCLGGIRKFGVLGFIKNQVPGMDLPFVMAIVLIPMIFLIEVGGLLIKHGVLAVRLLANMVAGHLVILAIMGMAFGAAAALSYSDPNVPSWQWPVVATASVAGTTLFNMLELFVAFLQAYVFTFLSALFIGAAVHKH